MTKLAASNPRAARFRRAGVMVVMLVAATACDPGFINTPAGNGSPGFSGDGGAATAAAVDPVRIAWAPDGRWAFTDTSNHVRLVGTDGKISTIAGLGGFAPANGPLGDGGAASLATLSTPTGLAFDAAGDLFVADTGNNRVREIDHATGVISTVAGGGASTADGVAATAALVTAPSDVAVDASNDVFIVQSSSGLVRKVDGTTHLISTVAGGGASTADGVVATAAHLSSPGQVVVAATALDLAEAGAVRRVDLGTDRITTIAGTGTAGDSGDGGPATSAQVDARSGLAVDAWGNVYFSQANRVRKVVASTQIITTVVGTAAAGYSGDLGSADAAHLSGPLGLALNAAGTLLVADAGNHRVRAVQRLASAPTAPPVGEPVPLGGGHSWFGGDASKYGLPQTTTTSGGPQDFNYPPVNTSDTTYVSTLTKNANGNFACAVSTSPDYTGIVGWKYFDQIGSGTNTKPAGVGVPSPLPTCTWSVTWTTTTTTSGPQPITYPNPGFWAQVAGPESDATNGDAFSPRCYGGNLCPTVTNNSYRPGGYTYAITVPTTNVPASLDVQVFDAGLYPRSSQQLEAGDAVDNNTAGVPSNFTTGYQLYNTDGTPLDATDNPAMTAAGCGGLAGSQSPDSGHWQLAKGDAAATFENSWVTLCHISAPVPGAVYYLRVSTDHAIDGTTQGSGFNRYALQVLNSSGSAASIAPYADESLFVDAPTGSASFELANVSPQYAGRTLALNLWDPGDAGAAADVTVTVQPPTGTTSCTWVSAYGVGYASPPPGNGFGGTVSSPSSSGGTISPCAIATSTSGTRHFNGDWVQVRVAIPTDYTCDPSTPSTCEWTIRYDGTTPGLTDSTTWAALIL